MREFGREKYRVIQWATGSQGQLGIAMVTAANRPHLELVGCWVFSAEKAGADAGTLAGVDPAGVAATTDVDALIDLDADCVIYSPFFADWDVVCRLLESGKNVLTQVGDIFLLAGEKRERLQAACQTGGVSLYAAGINPGFFSDRLCATLTTLCSEVEHIQCCEYSDGPPTGLSPYMLFEGIGFGWTQERLKNELPLLFASKLHDDMFFSSGDFIANALGFSVDERRTEYRWAMADRDINAFGRVTNAGTVGAVSPLFRMLENGRERMLFSQCWKLDPSVPIEWGYDRRPKSFYQIKITGRPSFELFWEPAGDGMADAVHVTAASVVNAIPFVCDAPPGIRTQIDLSMLCFSGELGPVGSLVGTT
ncbi:MAG: NAD(P)H-dependent amine dehydrogenase family protein [Sporichthyaceae bacterium]